MKNFTTIFILLLACTALALPNDDSGKTDKELSAVSLSYFKASYYLNSGQPEKTLIELDFALKGDPDSAQIYILKGKAQLSLRRHELVVVA